MENERISELERLFLALADKTRLRLLSLMVNGEVSVGYLASQLGESQPKTSRHLAYLRNAGLVDTRRDGKWIYYFMSAESSPAAEGVLKAILGGNSLAHKNSHVQSAQDLSEQTHMSEFHPNEIDVFLL